MTIKVNQKVSMNTDVILRESFRLVGNEYGYENVNAEFVAFKEFKVKWQRSYKWADFQVSDYLMDAPKEVIEGLARTLMAKIAGLEKKPYSEEMCQWVTADDFAKFKQPIYIRRSRDLARTHEGKSRNLRNSFQRLKILGLVKDDPQMVITWTKEPNIRRVGYCSVLMRVLAISSVFDNVEIPEFVLDYVLYHEYIHMTQGLKFFGKEHDEDSIKLERLYPRSKEAEDWLNKLCLYL